MRPDATSNRAKVVIRLARPEERQALEDLMRRASLALPAYREQLEAHPEAIDLPARQITRGDVLVAEVGDEVAGFAALEGGELDGLFVEPDQWRRRIGSTLVRAVVHEARRRGLSLTVVAGPEARPFYEACGFSVDGNETTRFGPAFRMSR
jgi:N-acetylglutamate synthase-like GNAT family acetyltransferase